MLDAPRCRDDGCQVKDECQLYQQRNNGTGFQANTWRRGWEVRDELCQVAQRELESGDHHADD